VLRTRPAEGDMSREAVQLGAELFGCSTITADIEINRLMVQSIRSVVHRPITIDLGSVSIAQSVSDWLELSSEQSLLFFKALQAKDTAALDDFSKKYGKDAQKVIMALPKLYGNPSILDTARDVLINVPGAGRGIDEIYSVYQAIKEDVNHVIVDLAELRGFQYHSGLVVSVYVEGEASPIARGGRYDHVGESFGRSRPATGFTIDLRKLTQCTTELSVEESQRKIWAPCMLDDLDLSAKIKSLRESGDIVVEDILGVAFDLGSSGYTHKVIKEGLNWSLVAIKDNK
ncbi:MAG: ATP phosphoribosyltransferase regulatory subunit, partial [Burkholderiales bacterium]|nr:ATP phosphoribosyltransferase regulatory subunit [Burkholderiales bacterium]